MFAVVRKGMDKIYAARHPSVCGLLRIHRPLGSLANGCLPQRLPCKGSCLRQQTEGCSAWLHLYSDGLRHIRGGRERPPYKLTGNVCRAFYRQPAANLSGPMKIIAPLRKGQGNPEGTLQHKAAMHPSGIADAMPPPLARAAFKAAAARKASPARGGGCAVRRRRRGAALGCALTPAGRQGVHRCLCRGRCLHRPAGVAVG